MDYLVVSTAVTDDLYLADGTHRGTFLGGAGTYALCGVRLWTDRAVLATGVGEDFARLHGGWFEKNGCSTAGLTVKDPRTAVSVVRYQADGERVETPRYGGEHYRRLEAVPEELRRFYPGLKGAYIFKDLAPAYWRTVLSDRAAYGFPILWELNADAARPECLPRARALAEACGLFSLNRTEAGRLLGTGELDQIVKALSAWRTKLIYLRLGSSGAAVLAGGGVRFIPCAPCGPVVDPTGAGNSSTAAVLCGWCEGASPTACGVMGAISAARCIEQFGPPDLSDGVRARALADREAMLGGLEAVHEEK